MRCCLLLAAFCLPALLPTTGFAQWQMQNSNSTADLRGIDNVGNGVAWASGTHGTVLRTEDGGYVWQTCAVPPGAEKLDFRGVQAFDANTAIVMSSGPGDQSRLYKTTDGCHTWKLLFTNPDKDGFWDAVDVGGKVIMILGDPVAGSFTLRESHNAGHTWYVDRLPKSLPGEGAFAASNSSLISDGADGLVMFGTGGPDGSHIFVTCGSCATEAFRGGSWAVEHMPMFGTGASAGIFAIAGDRPESSRKFVAVGGDYSKPEQSGEAAFASFPNLHHWSASATPPHGYRSSVAYDSADKLWITVGPNGTDVSSDDGRNWRAVHPDAALHEAADADRNWNAISLPFVVGPHGRIGRLETAAVKRK